MPSLGCRSGSHAFPRLQKSIPGSMGSSCSLSYALHPSTVDPHAVSYPGLPQISRVGEEIPLCLMERMGPSGSKVRGQKAPKGQEKKKRSEKGQICTCQWL